MFNNQREKTMAAILGGAIVMGFGFQFVDGWLLQPVEDIRSQVIATQRKNEQLELDLALVDHAQRNLKNVRDQSLPAEPATASLMYQDWLMDRVRDARLKEPVVTPGRAIAENGIGHRIPFTVQAEANLRQIGRFLDDFYRTPVLHRITFLKIDNAGQRSSTARKLTLTLEALALTDAPAQDSLPRPGRQADRNLNRPTLENYFARNDPFRRTVIKATRAAAVVQARPTAVKKTQPYVDALATIRLVASIAAGDARKAWFFDTRTDKEFILAVGEELSVTGFTGRVVKIEADSITLASNETAHTTRLGETLRDCIKPAVH